MMVKINNSFFSFLFALLCIISCNNPKVTKEYYPDGTRKIISTYTQGNLSSNVEYYNRLGNLVKKVYYTKGVVDSLIGFKGEELRIYKKQIGLNNILQTRYYKNGKIESEGFIVKDTLKIGWWSYYDTIGKIKSKREYILLCDDYYLNQSILFDKQKDTIYRDNDFNESVFFNFDIKELDDKNELSYDIKPISYRSNLELIFLRNDDFCKEEGNIDTIIPLKTRKGKLFFNKKRKLYTGFIFDYYIDTVYVNGKMKINSISRKVYFDKTIDENKEVQLRKLPLLGAS